MEGDSALARAWQRQQPVPQRGAIGAARHMRGQPGGAAGIQLVVQLGLQQQAMGLAAFAHASTFARSRAARARQSRDITVPTGTPVTWAISR